MHHRPSRGRVLRLPRRLTHERGLEGPTLAELLDLLHTGDTAGVSRALESSVASEGLARKSPEAPRPSRLPFQLAGRTIRSEIPALKEA